MNTFDAQDKETISRIAEKNGVPVEKVLAYIDALACGRKVLYHLDLSL